MGVVLLLDEGDSLMARRTDVNDRDANLKTNFLLQRLEGFSWIVMITTGGVIRNAALHASLLALDEDQSVEDRHLLAGVRREYRRTGGTCPLPG
jgi:hypothetical protein